MKEFCSLVGSLTIIVGSLFILFKAYNWALGIDKIVNNLDNRICSVTRDYRDLRNKVENCSSPSKPVGDYGDSQ